MVAWNRSQGAGFKRRAEYKGVDRGKADLCSRLVHDAGIFVAHQVFDGLGKLQHGVLRLRWEGRGKKKKKEFRLISYSPADGERKTDSEQQPTSSGLPRFTGSEKLEFMRAIKPLTKSLTYWKERVCPPAPYTVISWPCMAYKKKSKEEHTRMEAGC